MEATWSPFTRRFYDVVINYWGDFDDLKSQVQRSGVLGEWLIFPQDTSKATFISRTRDFEGYPTFNLTWTQESGKARFRGTAAKLFLRKFRICEMDPLANLARLDTPDRVLHSLFLGSQEAALNRNGLLARQITHVLTVGKDLKQPFRQDITYKLVEAWDDPNEELYQHFEHCIDFIDAGRAAGCVLIHCAAGISRSATITIAYVMKEEGLNLRDAFGLVYSKHYICPNEGFLRQLMRWEQHLINQGIIEQEFEDVENFYYSIE